MLSTSPRKCTVTGIDNHEIPALDLVQCAVLFQTNHGMVNLIMNEYGYYGRGHSIHSSGQIEWLWMINLSKLVANRELVPLIYIRCHWYVKVD